MSLGPGAQQRLADCLIGRVRAAEHQQAKELQPRTMVLDKPAEGLLVAGSSRREQVAFVRGVHRRSGPAEGREDDHRDDATAPSGVLGEIRDAISAASEQP